MRRKLLLVGKTSLLMKRISIITSLVLAVLTVGTFFLKTSTIIDNLNVDQKSIGNATVEDTIQTISTIKVIGNDSSSCNDKSVSLCLNGHFQDNAIHGKECSFCYFVSDSNWDNDDGGHYDEEDSDVYDDEDRENEYERKDAQILFGV